MAPESELSLVLRAPLALVVRRLDAALPRVLAEEEDRPIGAPGRASYTAARGAPRLRASAERLSVFLPLDLNIAVCKPFGSLCVGYGRCAPRYEVEVSLPTAPRPDFGPGRPKVRVRALRGCTIVTDVTPQLTELVEGEAKRLERDLARQLAAIQPDLGRVRAALTRPLPLGQERCAWLDVDAVTFVPPRVESEALLLEVALRGRMVPADCAAERPAPELPPPTVGPGPKRPLLHVPELLPLDALERHLKGGLEGSAGEPQVRLLSLAANDDALALGLELTGSHCGTVWLNARPVGRSGRVELAPTLLGPALDPALEAALLAEVQAAGAPALRAQAERARQEAERALLDGLAPLLAEAGLVAERRSSPGPLAIEARVTAEGLMVTQSLSGSLRFELSEHAQPAP